MKLSDVIFALEEVKPSYLSSEEVKKYISLLDSSLTDRPVLYTDDEDKLLLPEPYSEVYTLYLKAEAELKLGEIENYNNTYILFRSLLDQYKRSKMRLSAPTKQTVKLM